MKKNESKYFYTAELMNQALLELLEKKDIEFITVTEITKKAGVNRSTFYLHYENIYELLEETIENLNKKFISSFQTNLPLGIHSKKDAFLLTEDFLVPYLRFCKEHQRVLRLVHQKPHLFKKNNTYQKMYDTIFYPAISQFIDQEKEKIYYLEFFTQGIVGIIHKWLDLGCKTEIDELIDIIQRLVHP
jgi:AcrR family transcriptional regulator